MNIIKKLFYVLLPLIVLGALCAGVLFFMKRPPEPIVRKLVAPVWDRPMLVHAGDTVKIKLKCGDAPEVEKVILQNTLFPKDLEFRLKVGDVSFDRTNKTAEVSVLIPKVIPEFLYDISVWYRDGITMQHERQPAAVKVQPARNGTFTFAVVTRLSFSKQAGGQKEREKKLRAAVAELNTINPDFIVVTNGAAESPWTANRDAKALYDLIDEEMQAPVFLLPNEDDIGEFDVAGMPVRAGRDIWNSLFGETHFSFDHEGFRFIGADSFSCGKSKSRITWRKRSAPGCMGDGELAWLEARLADAAKYKLKPVIFMHNNPSQENWMDDRGVRTPVFDADSRAKVLELCKKYAVQAVFSGHIERDSMNSLDGTLFVTTGSGGGVTSPGNPDLRLISIVGGKLDERYISYVRTPESIPWGKVSTLFMNPNDGTANENTITIINDLKRPLNNVSVVVNMARRTDSKEYTVYGKVSYLQTYGRAGQFIFIHCDMLPEEKKIIHIK